MQAVSPEARGAKWAEIALPTGLMLVVSIPVMVVEEVWHCRPMIDDPNHLWMLPAFLVASAVLFGGALAGFRSPSTAVAHVVAAASFALAVLLLSDPVRRLWVVHQGVPPMPVVSLWCLRLIVAFIRSLVGSLLGLSVGNRQVLTVFVVASRQAG